MATDNSTLMLPVIEEHLAQIESLCRKHQVRRLELFGSAARGNFRPGESDLDFFVEFEPSGWKGSFKRYMGLKLDLEDLFSRPVDLVEPKAIVNPYFAEVANRNRALVYAA
jgi:predicted nucleotidyltransferase